MIGIVSHDSGGAELLSSWVVKNNHKKKFLFSLSGPALRIFKSKIKNIKNRNINFLIEHVDKLVTSTSWPPRNEMKAIKLSKKKKFFAQVILIIGQIMKKDLLKIINYIYLMKFGWATR